jgi:hypothetical protein
MDQAMLFQKPVTPELLKHIGFGSLIHQMVLGTMLDTQLLHFRIALQT